MTKPTLSEQREAVEALICFAKDADIRPEIIDRARFGVLSLAWFERRQEIVKEVARLEQQAPELAAVLREFPGAQITGVK